MRKGILVGSAVCLALLGICLLATGATRIVNGKDEVFLEILDVKNHFHTQEHWFGVAAAPSGTVDVGDYDVMAPFVPDAGNNTWGAWLQVIGSGDTPVLAGNIEFNPHFIFVTAVERNTSIHRLQLAWHATSATTALADGDYTEVMFKPSSASFLSLPVPLRAMPQPIGTLMWVRIWADGQNTGTADMFVGIHED